MLNSLDQVATCTFLTPKSQQAPELEISPLAYGNGALFRRFADLPIKEVALLGFANSWGLLGTDLWQEFVPADEYGDLPPQGIPTARGEPVDSWYAEIRLLSEAILLWELTLEHSRELSKALRRPRSREIFMDESDPRFQALIAAFGGVVATPEVNPKVLAAVAHGGDRVAAIHYLYRVINSSLRKLEIEAVLTADDLHQRPALQFRPKDLLGVVWLQFAQAVETGKTFYKCDQCKSWLDRPRGKRSDFTFCDARCGKQYRLSGQKEKANEMRAAGHSFGEIAVELKRPESLVASWIEGRKARESFRERVIRMVQQGVTPSKIAAQLNTSEHNIRRAMEDDGSR